MKKKKEKEKNKSGDLGLGRCAALHCGRGVVKSEPKSSMNSGGKPEPKSIVAGCYHSRECGV